MDRKDVPVETLDLPPRYHVECGEAGLYLMNAEGRRVMRLPGEVASTDPPETGHQHPSAEQGSGAWQELWIATRGGGSLPAFASKILVVFFCALLASVLLQSPAQASYLGYNAADYENQIVWKKHGEFNKKYSRFLANAAGSWNNERTATGNDNFARFVQAANTNDPATLDVRLYKETDSRLGFYRHYPGPKQDWVRINKLLLGFYSGKQKQKTVTHELGHSNDLAHSTLDDLSYCNISVMTPSATCYAGQRILPFTALPAGHDREDVAGAPLINTANTDTVLTEPDRYPEYDTAPTEPGRYPEYDTFGGEKAKVSETVVEQSGVVTIIEYAPPVPFRLSGEGEST
jgi:hypothetical protein